MGWFWIFVGGGIGAALRGLVAAWIQDPRDASFPWAILLVNMIGCFGIGFVVTWLEARLAPLPNVQLFLVTGVLGGFTTFSAFGLDTWRLLVQAEWMFAIANVAASVLGGLVAVMLGVLVARALA